MSNAHSTHAPATTLRHSIPVIILWLIGAAAFALAWSKLDSLLCDVVTYRLVFRSAPPLWGTYIAPAIAILALLFAVVIRLRPPDARKGRATRLSTAPASKEITTDEPSSESRLRWIKSAYIPLFLIISISIGWATYAVSPDFVTVCLLAISVGWAIASLGSGVPLPRIERLIERIAIWLVVVAIVVSTWWHTSMQITLWQHFNLGFADFGFFVRELEQCLPWKDVPERFSTTRMAIISCPSSTSWRRCMPCSDRQSS